MKKNLTALAPSEYLDEMARKGNEAMLSALRTAHSFTSSVASDPKELARQRRSQQTLGKLLSLPIGFDWETFEIEGIPAAWAKPEHAAAPPAARNRSRHPAAAEFRSSYNPTYRS